MLRLALLLLAAACAVSAQQLELAGTATFFSPASDASGTSCMFPAGTPTGWAGQAALSVNSSLTLQARAAALADLLFPYREPQGHGVRAAGLDAHRRRRRSPLVAAVDAGMPRTVWHLPQ